MAGFNSYRERKQNKGKKEKEKKEILYISSFPFLQEKN